MSYTVRLAGIEAARAECINYMGRQKYIKFVNTIKVMTQNKSRTAIYRTVSFACGMVGMRGYLITRAVFLDVVNGF